MLAASLLVVHDTSRGSQDDVAELTRGQELDSPLLDVLQLDGVARVDDTALVQAAVQLDDDLAGAVVVDLLELADVAYLSHHVSMLQRFKSRQIQKSASETCKISAILIFRALKRQTSWDVETGRLVISPRGPFYFRSAFVFFFFPFLTKRKEKERRETYRASA